MNKKQPAQKKPSRKRYEEEHPTISFRLDKATYERLKEHLEMAGCSFASFIKDSLGREETMVEKRVEMIASAKVDPSIETQVRYLKGLVHELHMRHNTRKWPPACPHCENDELYLCEGVETLITTRHPEMPTWKCAKCGFFIDTSHRIDPKSLRWVNPDTDKFTDRPTPSIESE
jgi:hypothetical protein